MRHVLSTMLMLLAVTCAAQQPSAGNAAPCREPAFSVVRWAQLDKYKAANAQAGLPPQGEIRVIFFGSSTTENWGSKYGSVFFPGEPYLNRGVSGQTTSQMLLRFEQDVVALQPAVVIIFGGSNDVAGNTGPATLPMIENNLAAMAKLAASAGIRVIFASQQPTTDFPWHPGTHPATELLALSAWEKAYAQEQKIGYVDYYAALVGPDGNYKAGLSVDGVHPTAEGYRVMAPLAERAIADALARPVVTQPHKREPLSR